VPVDRLLITIGPMALTAGTAMLGAVGHLANLGQFAELGQAAVYQREQIEWTRRFFQLDLHTLRLDLLNAVKEDIRDVYGTYAGRIDTLLLVQTLLFTFGLATLQFSDQFIPQTPEQCGNCVETRYPSVYFAWVILVGAVLILPFWCMVMSIWCKLQLDKWLEQCLGRVNHELRAALRAKTFYAALDPRITASKSKKAATESDHEDEAAAREAARAFVEQLGEFMAEYQRRFSRLWGRECGTMVRASSFLLWVSASVAVLLTSLMFWLLLANHGPPGTSYVFFTLMTVGLLMPAVYALTNCCTRKGTGDQDQNLFESCASHMDFWENPHFASANTEMQSTLLPTPQSSPHAGQMSPVTSRSNAPTPQPSLVRCASDQSQFSQPPRR